MEKQTIVYRNLLITNENLFTAQEYALLHDVNPKTVYDWINKEILPVHICRFKNRTYKLIDPYYPAPKTYKKPKNQAI